MEQLFIIPTLLVLFKKFDSDLNDSDYVISLSFGLSL